MAHRRPSCCLPCLWSWFWLRRTAGTPQCPRGRSWWPRAGECCTTAMCVTAHWVINTAYPHREHEGTIYIYIYNTYSMFTNTPVWVPVSMWITLSLTFRSAPWLLRALMTSRLPPLHAQWMAREPSWNTVGGTYPINSADFRPLEAAALVCEDNLTQSHHHLCKQASVATRLTWSLKLISAPCSKSFSTTSVCPSSEARCRVVLFIWRDVNNRWK